MNNLRKITIQDFEGAYEALVEFHVNSNDPLPEFMGNESKIISILDYPFQSVFGKAIYWGFYK